MIDLASKTNLFMPHYVVHRAEVLLNEKDKGLHNARILILGVTYKKDVKDLRESPALDIIELLQQKGAKVAYTDAWIPYLKINKINLKNTNLTKATIKKYDLLILVTGHSDFKYKTIAANARLILDTRNAFGMRKIYKDNIVKL